jgi:hypothetical protein
VGDEFLHLLSLVVEDTVDAEVQVGAVKLKELPQQVLELPQCPSVF